MFRITISFLAAIALLSCAGCASLENGWDRVRGMASGTSPEPAARAESTAMRPAIPPVAAPPRPGATGQDAFEAIRTARDAGCGSTLRPTMLDKGGGYEIYSLTCADGRTLVVRCDFGTCKAQQ